MPHSLHNSLVFHHWVGEENPLLFGEKISSRWNTAGGSHEQLLHPCSHSLLQRCLRISCSCLPIHHPSPCLPSLLSLPILVLTHGDSAELLPLPSSFPHSVGHFPSAAGTSLSCQPRCLGLAASGDILGVPKGWTGFSLLQHLQEVGSGSVRSLEVEQQPEIPPSWQRLPRGQIGLTRAEDDGLFLQRQGYFQKARFKGD